MSHRKGKRRRREEGTSISFENCTSDRAARGRTERIWFRWNGSTGQYEAQSWPADGSFWQDGVNDQLRRQRDYYGTRQWKSQPVPPGEHPYRVGLDGVVDLHPSQWSVR